jgi:hypothetical protein
VLPNAEANSASPAELTTTGIPEDSAWVEAFRVSGEWSERVWYPPIVEPERGLLRYDASENTVRSIGEGEMTWVAFGCLAQ